MTCYNSIVVNASIESVWNKIRDFHRLDWGSPVVTSVTAVGDIPGDQVGARRVLNGAFEETLIEYDQQEYRFAYRIDDGPEPISKESVSDYIGAMRLLPVTASGKTFVEWTSTFQSNDPDLVTGFCNPIYAAILESLKESFN